MFCPGYLEWWLDSTLNLVLFIHVYTQFCLSSLYMYYLRGGYSRPVPTSVGRTLYIHICTWIHNYTQLYTCIYIHTSTNIKSQSIIIITTKHDLKYKFASSNVNYKNYCCLFNQVMTHTTQIMCLECMCVLKQTFILKNALYIVVTSTDA